MHGSFSKLTGHVLVTFFVQTFSYAVYLTGEWLATNRNPAVLGALTVLFMDVFLFIIAAETHHQVKFVAFDY